LISTIKSPKCSSKKNLDKNQKKLSKSLKNPETTPAIKNYKPQKAFIKLSHKIAAQWEIGWLKVHKVILQNHVFFFFV
jgi:hypothetical protein